MLKVNNSEYGSKNWNLKVSNDQTNVEAWSYVWWKFLATDSVGNVYLNNTSYSPSTGQHQDWVNTILARLGIEPDLELFNTRSHFGHGIIECILSEIENLKDENAKLKKAIGTKGSWKKTNERRRYEIQKNEYRIKDLQRYMNEYVDKKRIPNRTKQEHLNSLIQYDGWCSKTQDWVTKICRRKARAVQGYKKYFRKHNGKLKVSEMQRVLNRCKGEYGSIHDAPECIDRMRELLGIKHADSIEYLLVYPFTKDVIGMIPERESREYKQLETWAKRMLKVHPKNELLMDKMHTYLTNKQNRRDYVPSEPTPLPVHPKLKKLSGTPELKLITTDRELRAEGRKQSHCIGSKQYLDACKQGYQVLNYKGYTFFLRPDLKISETHGRHNNCTPEPIRNELQTLIQDSEVYNEAA